MKKGEKAALFGAGHGSEVIAYFRKRGLEGEVSGVIDSDPSMCKRLLGFSRFRTRVVNPNRLLEDHYPL